MNIYVGNLPYSVNDDMLRSMFEEYGAVDSARIIMDRDTGRAKGFGFVEMGNDTEANAAVAALNGQDCEGRALTVNEARPRAERGSRGGGGGGYGGGGGGYGGGGGRY
ncbi:MAG: RNA-binding protein [Victivallales bacterium]|jgi:RNA recognition motif-containing protein|nr:RNA-binding protein [Victivallales bacterium]MBT7163849.1 RNA-binding protein [Victivallales bacterium]MBT7300735.1 RNA-binding protein [Victivallales bacterium]